MMINKGLVLVFTLLCSLSVTADVYQLSQPLNGSYSTSRYFDELGLDNIKIIRVCKKNKCIKNIVSRSKTLFRNIEANKTSVSIIAIGRYKNKAYALISESRKKTRYYLIDNNGQKKRYKHRITESLAKLINKDGKLVTVARSGILIDGQMLLASPNKLIRARIKNTPSGLISVTAVTDSNNVTVSNMEKWLSTRISLSVHGDIDNVANSYAMDDQLHYGVVYKYVNNYNKGLKIFKVDFSNNAVNSTWVFNSDSMNIGFNPDIHINKNKLILSTKNSTTDRRVHFSFDESLTQTANNIIPPHTLGFEQESLVSITAGGGLALQFWEANSAVKVGEIKRVDVDYDISSALYTSAFIEGRIANTRLGVSYLKNESEEKGGLIADASEYLSMYVDFNDFFEGSRSLRVSVENATINGVTSVEGPDVVAETTQFTTELNNYSFLVMAEQGRYTGLQISEYTMPSAIGFSTLSGSTTGYYDPDLGITRVSFVAGYDELSYSKRYETNLSRPYVSYGFGVGLGVFDISQSIKTAAETDLGAPISNSFFFEINAAIEYGYIYQKRLKSLSGFGAVFQAGYKASLSRMGSERGDKSEDAELVMEFERQDILHGPFVRAALIF